jgi:hypothetical protein
VSERKKERQGGTEGEGEEERRGRMNGTQRKLKSRNASLSDGDAADEHHCS